MLRIADRKRRWAVVLAGGDGTRLEPLTRLISGDPRPKQFCKIFGEKSLLAHTRERIAPLFYAEQTLFALARRHEPYYFAELEDVDDRQKIVQPANLGTAVAVAVCLQAIVREDEDAVVAFFPSDHHYLNTAAFQASVEAGLRTAEEYPHHALLVGARPAYAETEYGWIEPGRTLVESPDCRLQLVKRFWEKPLLAQAEELLASGCLWNTFVTIGLACAFLDLLRATTPRIARLLEADGSDTRLEEIFRTSPPVDFSRAVLSRVPHRLLVLQDEWSGWTDLGSTGRVFDVLSRESTRPAWLPKGADAVRGWSFEPAELRGTAGRLRS